MDELSPIPTNSNHFLSQLQICFGLSCCQLDIKVKTLYYIVFVCLLQREHTDGVRSALVFVAFIQPLWRPSTEFPGLAYRMNVTGDGTMRASPAEPIP